MSNAINVMDRLLDEVTEAELRPGLDIREFLDALLQKIGGPSGLAEEVYKDFTGLDPGHANRIRLEGMLLSLLERASEGSDESIASAEMLRAKLRKEIEALEVAREA